MHISWSRCPLCKATLKVDFKGGGPWNSILGEPTILECPHCKGKFTDGKKEWDDMSLFQKLREIAFYSLIGLIFIPIVNLLLAGLITKAFFWIINSDLSNEEQMPYFFGLGFILIVISWKGILDDFLESKKRSRKRRESIFSESK